MVDLFDKCTSARMEEYHLAVSAGLLPFFLEMESESGPVVRHAGRDLVMLGSNNYLGLTADPRVKRAAVQAVERYGTGCTGSRLMNGTLPLHRELEEELCDWLGGEACLVYTTGYSVNLGILSTLVEEPDVVFVDASSHASIVDGARLAPGSARYFRHNSVSSLRRRLAGWRRESNRGGALVAVDGVYSMEGDLSPVSDIAGVCAELGARLLVDEAHGLGVIGPAGAGVAAAAGLAPDLIMGTFSKSLASCGGFVMGPRPVVDFLQVACRPFLFTAAGVPAALAAALAAVRVARAEPWRQEAVHERALQLHRGLSQLGYQVADAPDSAVVAVHIGEEWTAGRVWRSLLDQGVYTNCAIAPAVPKRGALLRTSVMATHTEDQIDKALGAFESVGQPLMQRAHNS